MWSPDGDELIYHAGDALFRVAASGGESELLTDGPAGYARVSLDGKYVYFAGQLERRSSLWRLSLEDGSERMMAELTGERGELVQSLATDGRFLYFAWQRDIGDIWVMDVVSDESK